jgi:uncharacterized integral membrane protein (TIGR00698 family)
MSSMGWLLEQTGGWEGVRPLLPGVAVVLALACVVQFGLAPLLPNVGDVTLAIFLGMLVGNLLPSMARFDAGVGFAERRLLPLAIALLGVELQLGLLLASGLATLVVIGASVAVALVAGVVIGRLMGFSAHFSLLIGAGNGICGTAAVAAVSRVIHADDEETGIALSVVGLLGTVGILLMPLLAGALALTTVQSGMLVGGTLQAVGQVVAAGYALGAASGGLAMMVKMGRVLLLGPVVVFISSRVNRRSDGPRVQVPLFIVGFFVFSLLASLHVIDPLLPAIKTSGKFLLLMATVGIGMHIQLRALLRSGPRALVFGVLVWMVQIAAVLALLWLLT